MVVFDTVFKTYKGTFWGQKPKTVLNGLTFEAPAGKITGLIGANGVGKTTTFKILSGLEHWDRGRIIVNGHDATNPNILRGNVGLLLEKHGFHKTSGRIILEQTGLYMGLTLKQAKIRCLELIENLHLDSFVDNFADTYSRGQLGQLGIARMMLCPPPVLIFDEPTVGLDFLSAARIRSYIQQCAQDGHTVLLATHLLNDIQMLCDQVVGIEHGVATSLETVQQWLQIETQQQQQTFLSQDLSKDTTE